MDIKLHTVYDCQNEHKVFKSQVFVGDMECDEFVDKYKGTIHYLFVTSQISGVYYLKNDILYWIWKNEGSLLSSSRNVMNVMRCTCCDSYIYTDMLSITDIKPWDISKLVNYTAMGYNNDKLVCKSCMLKRVNDCLNTDVITTTTPEVYTYSRSIDLQQLWECGKMRFKCMVMCGTVHKVELFGKNIPITFLHRPNDNWCEFTITFTDLPSEAQNYIKYIAVLTLETDTVPNDYKTTANILLYFTEKLEFDEFNIEYVNS